VFAELIRTESQFSQQSPRAYYFDPAFAKYWKQVRTTAFNLTVAFSNVYEAVQHAVGKERATLKSAFTARDLTKDV
jgi:hypothetical protein